MAIIKALKEWRHYLEGLPEPFEIITNHDNLRYWKTAQDLSRRQARWALKLANFDFLLIHRPGKTNVLADALSHSPLHQVSDKEDNTKQTVLRPEHFVKLAASHFNNLLEEKIHRATAREAEVVEGLKELKKGGLKKLVDGIAEWEEDEGLIYR